VKGLFAKTGLERGRVTKAAVYGPDARAHATVVRELGLEPAQVEDALFGKVGSAGAALAPLLLVSALEKAKAGETILVVAYGDGADALLLSTTPHIERLEGRRGVAWHLARRGELKSYDTYLRARQFIASEHDRRAGAGLSATKHFRDRDEDLTLLAQRCRRCGQTQFPRQRVCYKCFARDEFDRVRLSDKIGTVRSFTFDNFAGSPTPPLVAGIVEIEGARLYVQMTDVDPKEVKLGMPVEMTFRKIHEAGGTPNYFWKSTPVR
jgi:hydroxymethylglutaryl-CoA synthase